jgi:hypothetical protein
MFAVWKIKSGEAFAAGGAFPERDYEGRSRLSVTSEKDDGIDLIVEVDLNLQPQRIRREVVNLVEKVEKGQTSL